MTIPSSGAPEGRPPSQPRSRLRYLAGFFAVAIPALAIAFGWELRGIHFPPAAEVTSRRVIALKSADGRDLWPTSHLQLAPVDANAMPPNVINAVLSIEDRHFLRHGAIDFSSILRALEQNLAARKVVAGGSTITQQLVKTLFLGPERTYKRKIQEAAIAIWIEHKLTKDQILTSYLNNVYLGSGATGFPAAAKLYFDKKVADLTLPQAAMLAGMINAPAKDDPIHNIDAARRRAAAVLDAMVSNGKLSEQDALVAKLHPATPGTSDVSPPSTGWFVDWVYNKAAAVTPPLGGAVQIRTTLDLRLQQLAAGVVKSTLARYGSEKHVGQAALVAMRPDGAVVAMVGGRSYARSKYNRAVQAARQPGSAFKLFVYYAALRQGFSPTDEILDARVNVHGWQPENYGHHHHGEVALADAFANSLNDATVRLSQEVGIDQVIAAARDLGLRAPLQSNPSLALGTSEVTLLDLTSAYASVRAGRAPTHPWGISGIRTQSDKDDVPVAASESRHSLANYQGELIDLLQGVVEHGTGRAAALKGFAAGKTGTTQDYRDAWFVGFDDSLVVGVWVGNDDHTPMKGVVGGSLPAQMWKNFVEQASTPTTAEAAPTLPDVPAIAAGASASSVFAGDGDANPPAAEAQTAQCNIPACEENYRSFRASDCTYQPYWGGPRQYCAR
ncbi:PBP1A family penicillin-binding protein [Bradyrhizobium jicamae]|uniref:peptidoglycan glycosyltransferase n=1 Tax=Bradyrhizobium jicamae TaxID=280332 RepID=A0ABS5FL74_9BRAD|nr:PBP1A family penicillin-binding protein [Bradyrhizobium jicamae]MBR0797424.1 PBP1A family penicillin-binding protein [Bradyrhizobium jicamae]